MTPVEAETAIGRLLATFGNRRMGLAVRQTWTEALADLDAGAVSAGIDHLARTQQRMPSLALVLQAATRHTEAATAPADGTAWQVLATWTDEAGLAYAEPRRWHHDEETALDDYRTACVLANTRRAGAVELLRYQPGRPVHVVEHHDRDIEHTG